MRIDKIRSLRRFDAAPSMQIIYEWEDAFAKALNVPIKADTKLIHTLKSMFRPLFPGESEKGCNFYIEPHAHSRGKRNYGKGAILYIIHYNLPDNDFDAFLKYVDDASMVFIASRQVHEYLIKKGASPQRFRHLAISIPDQYIYTSLTTAKEYDIIVTGSIPQKYSEYLNRYATMHPELKILHKKTRHGRIRYYTTDGMYIGEANSRAEYMELLSRTRVTIYSVPSTKTNCINGNSLVFSGVTPQLLEALASGCEIVPHYSDNADTRFFELHKFGCSPNDYQSFEKALDNALCRKTDTDFSYQYLEKHKTSRRAETLRKILGKR